MNKFAVINNVNPDYAMWDADTRLLVYPFGCSFNHNNIMTTWKKKTVLAKEKI